MKLNTFMYAEQKREYLTFQKLNKYLNQKNIQRKGISSVIILTKYHIQISIPPSFLLFVWADALYHLILIF